MCCQGTTQDSGEGCEAGGEGEYGARTGRERKGDAVHRNLVLFWQGVESRGNQAVLEQFGDEIA